MTDTITNPARSMGAFIYTSDNGRRRIVELALRLGQHPSLGFEPRDITDRTVYRAPAGTAWEMRYVKVVNVETKLRRRFPLGKLSAPISWGPPCIPSISSSRLKARH